MNGDQYTFNLGEARSRRDAAMARVAAKSRGWFPLALARVGLLPTYWRGTGEDLRRQLLPVLGKPHHHNCWGTLVMHAIKRKLLRKTGIIVQMKQRSSHARPTPVLERVP